MGGESGIEAGAPDWKSRGKWTLTLGPRGSGLEKAIQPEVNALMAYVGLKLHCPALIDWSIMTNAGQCCG